MPSISTLRNTYSQVKSDIESKQKMANDLQNAAETHRSNGDDVRADLDEKSSERYRHDADLAMSQLAAIALQIQHQEKKVSEIKDKMEQKKKDFDKEMQKLQDELQRAA